MTDTVIALRAHIQAAHDRAREVSGLLEALSFLDLNDASANGRAAIIDVAERAAKDLSRFLDIVNVPQEYSK